MRNRFLRKFEIIQAEEYISFQKFNTSDNDILLLYCRLNNVFDMDISYFYPIVIHFSFTVS